MSKKTMLLLFVIIVGMIITVFLISLKSNEINDDKTTDSVNNTKLNVSQYMYHFVYSSSFSEKSEIYSTSDGVNFSHENLDINDIFKIEWGYSKNNIELYQEHNAIKYKYSGSPELESIKLNNPITYVMNEEELTITSYNNDIDINDIHIEDGNYNYTIPVASYVKKVIYDDNNIYVLSDVAAEEKLSIIYIIDRVSQKIKKQIELDTSTTDIIQLENNLLVSTNNNFYKIDLIDNFSIEKFPLSSNDIEIDHMYSYKDVIYVLYGDYSDGKIKITTLDNKTLGIINTEIIMLDELYTFSKFIGDKLYLLEQYEPEESSGGKLFIYDLSKSKIIQNFEIPKSDNKVQDFLVNY